MQTLTETLVFTCEGASLCGVLHRSAATARRGVLIVVGGPQYRVGSHRQFVHLARHLAAAGIPVFRFDYRGMGDSQGEFRGFESAGPDIAGALNAFRAAVPELSEIVLWGLCDAASAAAFYAAGNNGAGNNGAIVRGMVLANPWVRTEQGLARSYVRSYYGQRLLKVEFWKRLLSGQMNVLSAVRGMLTDVIRATRPTPGAAASGGAQDAGVGLPERLRRSLSGFSGPICVILSGADLTAREFEGCWSAADWGPLRARKNIARVDLPESDHTFSRRHWTDEVSAATLKWLNSW